MISLDGASLLAQVIPVGLLVIGIEIRATGRFVATTRPASVMLWATGVLFVLALLGGAWSVVLCVRSVASGEVLDGPVAAFVGYSAGLVVLTAALLLLQTFAEWAGIVERLHAVALRNPKSRARIDAYVEREIRKNGGPSDTG